MELKKSVKFITDPVVTEYVNRIGQNIVKNSDAKGAVHHQGDRLGRDQCHGAAGGVLLREQRAKPSADDEAEMAGVMVHEISHVAAHHAMREQTRMNYAQFFVRFR